MRQFERIEQRDERDAQAAARPQIIDREGVGNLPPVREQRGEREAVTRLPRPLGGRIGTEQLVEQAGFSRYRG